jgi:hypothetical protein
MPRNFIKYPALFLSVLAALAALPATAEAVVRSSPAGPVSYLPLEEEAGVRALAPSGATVPTGSPPLEWHGGPVMKSSEAFAIFWAPSGFSFPSGYKAAITEYLEDVAADSGLSTNVYSVSAQYGGSNGFVDYEDSFGGSIDDTDAYPSTGTCPAYTGVHGASYTACLSDAKIRAEVASVVASQGWPSGLGAEYYVVLPPEVGSCFGTTSTSGCFDKEFCAYHSFIGGPELVYANISYGHEDPSGCGVGEYPNGFANGFVDDTLSGLSHEANESVTDPELNAWFDEEGLENGDECRNTPFEEDYGPALGGSAGALFNEEIGGGHYYLQREWSNDIDDCAQRVGPAQPVIVAPSFAEVGEPVSFDGSSSIPGDGGIVFYEWEFGDGSGAEGEEEIEVTHSYSAPGTYNVTLTVYDDGGFGYSESQQITVEPPEEEGALGSPGGGGGGTGTGTVTVAGSSSSSSSSSSAPAPAPAAGVAVAAAKAKVKHGTVGLKLTCSGGGPCSGVVKLLDHGVIGHAAFHLGAGATKVVKVRLTAGGLTLLAKKAGRLKVALSGTGVRHRTVTLSV